MYSREISKRYYFNINNNKLISHSMVLLNKKNNTNTSSKNIKVFPSLHISRFIWYLDICCITDKRDIRIHTSKGTPNALYGSKEIKEKCSGPEMHSKTTPIECRWHPTAHKPGNLQGYLD